MPKTLFRDREYEREQAKKEMGSPRRKVKPKAGGKAYRKAEAEAARKMLKKMGESGPEIRRKRQKDRAKKAGLILADNDTTDTEETEEGAMDDDAIERQKENERKKKEMLEAAGKA